MSAARERPELILHLLDRMKSELITPNTIVLTTAIDSLARGGGNYTQRAYDIIKDMELNGPAPNIYTYNTIVRSFAEEGNLDDALSILNNIKV